MLTSGDVVELDFGNPTGREAGFRHPGVVITAQRLLDAEPNVVQVIPLSTTLRGFDSEVEIEPDAENGLAGISVGQCQHIRSVAVTRIETVRGNVGAAILTQLREVIGLILDVSA